MSPSQDSNAGANGAVIEFASRMFYSNYLHLDRILDAQHPLSDAHDEMLFIIQHVSFLKRMLEVELFPELWRVRTAL
jgi:tryptophan 2,3-dioxygenase